MVPAIDTGVFIVIKILIKKYMSKLNVDQKSVKDLFQNNKADFR